MDATRALDGSFLYPNRRNFDGTPENYLEFFANAYVEDAVLHRASTAYAQAVEAALLQAWSEGENRPSDYLVNGDVAELTKQYPLEYARDEAGDMEQLPVWKALRDRAGNVAREQELANWPYGETIRPQDVRRVVRAVQVCRSIGILDEEQQSIAWHSIEFIPEEASEGEGLTIGQIGDAANMDLWDDKGLR
ncbi:hypothetical protein [Pseudoclavibacter helvolus]|uniref:hypothetical protein n=1 Tax=Pseudoclavibacter helvolus TaxID=255205 RepID=UPI00083913CE|nr:hypothetical protein [Pseudoclavibacter helvolus]